MKKVKSTRLSASSFHTGKISDVLSGAIRRDLRGLLPEGNIDAKQLYASKLEPIQLSAYRQTNEILKKFKALESDDKLDVVAYDKFFKVCDHIRSIDKTRFRLGEPHERPECVNISSYRGRFPLGGNFLSPKKEWERLILARSRNVLKGILGETISLTEWFRMCKHGNGTTIGTKYSNTSVEAKFTYPISGTSEAVRLFDTYLKWDTQLATAICDMNRFSNEPKYVVVEGSRATTVDKNVETDRMIAIEPTLNMFFQQGLMQIMYRRLKRFGLDLECLQDEHKLRALYASVTGREATIDFSSASDCVIIELVKGLFPPQYWWCINLIRSPNMEIQGESVSLPMISTMGNATTFPIETLVFLALGIAVHSWTYDQSGSQLIELELYKNRIISVFGDDCIIPTEIVPDFLRITSHCGFIVNIEKSFYDEKLKFRESCGGDFYDLHDVRPFYLKAPTGTRISDLGPWLCIIVNRCLKKYIQYFGTLGYAYDHELWTAVRSIVDEYQLNISAVPADYPDDSGFKILDDLDRLHRIFPFLKLPRLNYHGTAIVNYFSWKFPEETWTFGGIHYALGLRSSSGESLYERLLRRKTEYSFLELRWLARIARKTSVAKARDLFQKDKKIGGYVVVKGFCFLEPHGKYANSTKFLQMN